MADDPYVYPGTNVLRDHFGIRDTDELARRENDASNLRLLQLRAQPLPGRYDLAHLQAIHRHIFGDIYAWAGEIRTVAIAKGDLFALAQHIEPYLTERLAQLPAENYLRGLPRTQLAERLTHYLAEINSVHRFREGNGRTQRAFIGQLAAGAGYRLAWERLDPERNLEASRAAHRGDEEPLRTVLGELVEIPEAEEAKRLASAALPRRAGRGSEGPPEARRHRSIPTARPHRHRRRYGAPATQIAARACVSFRPGPARL